MRRSETAVVMGGMLVQQVTAFLASVCIARYLGARGFGEVAIMKNLSTFVLILAPLGLDLALLKHSTFYPPGSREFNGLWTCSRVLVLALNLVLLLLTAAAVGPLLQRVYADIGDLSYLCVVALLGLIFAADVQISGAIYRVLGRINAYSVAVNYCQSLLRLALTVLVLSCGGGVAAVIWVNSIAYVSSFVALSYLDHRSSQTSLVVSAQGARLSLAVLSESLWMAVSLLIYQAMRFMDVLVLGALTNTQVTGQYNAISGIAQIIQIYPMAASQMMGPRIAEFYRQGNRNEIISELKLYLHRARLLGGYMFAGVAIFGTQLDLVFGRGFQFSWQLAMLLATGWYASAILSPFGYVLSMTGRHKSEVAILGLGVGCLLLSLFLFIPYLADVGAALSVLLAFLVVNLVRCAYVVRIVKENPLSWRDLSIPILFLLGAFASQEIGGMLLDRSLVSLVAECALYSCLSAVTYFFLSLSASDRSRVYDRVTAYARVR